ncbi:MAG: hypothetical protein DWI48_03400 [Chloroflexi bacterium]|nr:MAG: hypothetical protein DWI48_03400 [Chloroflexota bacterium]
MSEAGEVWTRVHEDERATLARIETIEAQLTGERRHLEEVRLFQSMLNGYDSTLPGDVQPGPSAPSPLMAAALSEAQAEELDRLNRLFGLAGGDDSTS